MCDKVVDVLNSRRSCGVVGRRPCSLLELADERIKLCFLRHELTSFPSTFYHGMDGGAMGRSDTVDIRDSLKLYLDAHDVVQAQLAKEAGMTRQKLNAALHKQRKLDANELMKICDVLEISADDLWCQT